WNQIGGLEPQAPDGPTTTTIQLRAAYGGTLEIGWSTGDGVRFFGALPPTYSLTIDGPAYVPPPPPVVVEPPPVIVEPPPVVVEPPPVVGEPPPVVEQPPVIEPPSDVSPPPSDLGSDTPSVPEPSGALILSITLLIASSTTKRGRR